MTKAELMFKKVCYFLLWILLIVGINAVIIHQVVDRAYNDGYSAAYRSAIRHADKMIANNELEMKRKDAEMTKKDAEMKMLKERRCY